MKRILLLVAFFFVITPPMFSHDAEYESIPKLDSLAYQLMDSLMAPSFHRIITEYQALADLSQNPRYLIGASKYRVNRYYVLGETDSLVMYVKETMALSKKYNDDYNYYMSWSYLINHYTISDKNQLAIEEAKKMQNEAFSSDNEIGKALSLVSLGEAYYYFGNYGLSQDCLEQGLNVYLSSKDKDYFSISSVYYSLNLALIADKKYDETLTSCDSWDAAIGKMDEEEHGNTIVAFKLVSACARLIALSRLHQFSEANQYLTKIESYYAQVSSQTDYYLEAKSVYYEEIADYEKALIANQSAIDYFVSMNMLKEELRFTKSKSFILMKLERYQEATQSYYHYTNLKDSLDRSATVYQLNEMLVINDIQNAKIANQNLQIEVEHSKRVLSSISAIAFFIVVIILLSFLYRNKRMNKRLNEALIHAEESDRLKSAFLANMSHEIRTPLNAVVGFSNLLTSKEATTEDIEQYRNIINLNSDLLLKLINDILDLSRLDANPDELKLTVFDIVPLFNDLGVSFMPRITNNNVTLSIVNPYEECIVHLDKNKIIQMITNLVNNAIKFTDKGTITMSYKIVAQNIVFEVEDTGRGMTEEQKSKIFDRFYKADEFTQGSGLGMSIIYALIKNMKGTIEVSSELGKGTKFTVTIPTKAQEKLKNS